MKIGITSTLNLMYLPAYLNTQYNTEKGLETN